MACAAKETWTLVWKFPPTAQPPVWPHYGLWENFADTPETKSASAKLRKQKTTYGQQEVQVSYHKRGRAHYNTQKNHVLRVPG